MMLAEHPDILARLRNEVLKTVGPNGKVSPESLREMKYLRAVLDGKWFQMVRCSSNSVCRRDAEVVSKRVRIAIRPHAYNWAKKNGHSPWNIRCSKKGVVWPALDGGKPIYVPGDTRIYYLPWLIHRRKDLWGPDGKLPCTKSLLPRTRYSPQQL